MEKIKEIESLTIKIASPETILSWSYGEVTKPETINYRTQKPDKDGLFSERIFGPIKNYECYCGKLKGIKFKGLICDRCNVEITTSNVRRLRMGHITLAIPVVHIWYLRVIPSRISLLLDIPLPHLEKVIYYSAYIITNVNELEKKRVREKMDQEFKELIKNAIDEKQKEKIKEIYERNINELEKIKVKSVLSDVEYYEYSRKFGAIFEVSIGSEPIKKFLEEIDLEKTKEEIEEKLKNLKGSERKRNLLKLKLVKNFIKNKIRPEWMFLTVLPVIPPDLRPTIQLETGTYATSDLNDLYRRVINRNNRLKKLIELRAPEIILRNEKRMLQEAVDALLDNTIKKTQATKRTGGTKRPLKSLAESLKGKEGRFRKNLLGKRVDFSGRSVIVVGPELRLYECGIPKTLALEIFKPFVIGELLNNGIAQNISFANYLIELQTDEVWSALENVIKDKYVLLNRAPTLHRLGIQAFKPVLVEGLAIRIPPFVCTAFNADFDGDQMAIHLPLSEEAQIEAREILLSSKNILKPGSGEPITIPTLDVVLGCYWLTLIRPNSKGENKIFYDDKEAIFYYENKEIDLQAEILVKKVKNEKNIKTTVGRIIFNSILPIDFPFVNKQLNKKALIEIIDKIFHSYENEIVVNFLDNLKNLGFKYAEKCGLSLSISDFLDFPKEKMDFYNEILPEIENIEKGYESGLISEEERRLLKIEIFSKFIKKTNDVYKEKIKNILINVPRIMIDSGSKGNWDQLTQMASLKGLVSNPKGEVIELPIISNYKEGLDSIEYFISAHGARKGTVDTALKTAKAGYLTRRMVDVAQDVITRDFDCKDTKGWEILREDAEKVNEPFWYKIYSRVSLERVVDKNGNVIVDVDEVIDKEKAKLVEELGVKKLRVRSPLTCKSIYGVCVKCYGLDLAYDKLIKIAEACGIIAAQSIGEPGTQLTMRTFHIGGIASAADITQGIPRVEEILEARSPKNEAVISPVSGKVESIKKDSKYYKIVVLTSLKKKVTLNVPLILDLNIKVNDIINKGDIISSGSLDPKKLFKFKGKEFTIRYLLNEVKKIYNFQGVTIHDKHFEIIIRQMFSRVKIKDPGDSNFVKNEIVAKEIVIEQNRELKKAGLRLIKAKEIILGITRVALTAYSFLSAASFQETSRVLVKAAIEGRVDKLRGVKENVILGKKIPVGTGKRGLIF